MFSDNTPYSNQKYATANTPYNAIHFIIRNILRGEVNTALPVIVMEVIPKEEKEEEQYQGESQGQEQEEEKEDRFPQPDAVGFVKVLPLIAPYASKGTDGPQFLKPTYIPKIPYFRYQGGKAAVLCDPMPGDIGLAVFAQQDISLLGKENEGIESEGAVGTGIGEGEDNEFRKYVRNPGSFRTFSMSDGIYIGGLLNKAPDAWISFVTEDGQESSGEGEEEEAKIKLNIKATKALEMKTMDEFYVEADKIMIKSAHDIEMRASENIKLLGKKELSLQTPGKLHLGAKGGIAIKIEDVEFPDDEQPEPAEGKEEEEEQQGQEDKAGITIDAGDGDVEITAGTTKIKGKLEVDGDTKMKKLEAGETKVQSINIGGKDYASHKHTAPSGGGSTSGPI